jgi:hypothetical protein
MYQQTYFVSKRTGTFADVLAAYGLAAVLDQVLAQAKGQFTQRRVWLRDAGPYYAVELSEPLQAEWVEGCCFFRGPAFFLITGRTKPGDIPPDTDTRDVDETWDSVRAFNALRGQLLDEGLRGTDLENQLKDSEPPHDWPVVALLGDYRMQAQGTYNQAAAQWALTREHFALSLQTLLKMCATPDADLVAIAQEWGKQVKGGGIKRDLTASQLFNPHQGKGQNHPKANTLKMDNIKDSFWLEEYLKAAGLWLCAAPRTVVGDNDRKTYVLAPLNLTLSAHKRVFRDFAGRIWNERRGDTTAIKMDIVAALLYTDVLLEHSEAAQQDDPDLDVLGFEDHGPEDVVAGFHVAQYKLLSRNAYTMTNLTFLGLPAWTGQARNRAEVYRMKEVIEEHLDVIRGLDEGRSDGYNLLLRYRDFVSGGKWDSFFDFAVGYSHYLMRDLLDAARQNRYARARAFTVRNLEELMMRTNKPLSPILQSEGFKNVARAIRLSTITLQYLGRKQSPYDVRYGLAQELQRKAVDDQEFAKALGAFVQSFNAENARIAERDTGAWRRKDVTTADLDQVVHLVDDYGAETVCHLLVAYGYAREPKEEVAP